MDQTTTYSLPPVDLGRVTAEPTGFSIHSNYADTAATGRILEETALLLGVRPYHLGQLLGTSGPCQIYGWTAGRSRPCPLYWTRLMQLVLLRVLHGWSFIDIRRIDWETREVFPRKEKEKGDSNKADLPVGEWTFPKPVGLG